MRDVQRSNSSVLSTHQFCILVILLLTTLPLTYFYWFIECNFLMLMVVSSVTGFLEVNQVRPQIEPVHKENLLSWFFRHVLFALIFLFFKWSFSENAKHSYTMYSGFFRSGSSESFFGVGRMGRSGSFWVLLVVFRYAPLSFPFCLIRGLEWKLVDFIISVIWEVLIVSVSTV